MTKFDEAVRWLMKRTDDEPMTEEDQRRFLKWLKEDQENLDAYCTARAVYAKVGKKIPISEAKLKEMMSGISASSDSWPASIPLAGHPPRRYLRVGLGKAAAIFAIVAIIGFGLFSRNSTSKIRSYRTAIGELKTLSVSDGSQIEMDSRTTLETKISSANRHVTLTRGRAVFDVHRDPDRPFVVTTECARIRVVGTKFEVEVSDVGARVNVSEGKVEVIASAKPSGKKAIIPDGDAEKMVFLTTGERVDVAINGFITTVEPFATNTFAAWLHGKIEFRAKPLKDVVMEVERYFNGKVDIVDEHVNTVRITGSFSTSEPVQFLLALQEIVPIEVQVVNDRLIRIKPRES